MSKLKFIFFLLLRRSKGLLLIFVFSALLALTVYQKNWTNLSDFLNENLKWLNNLAVPATFLGLWLAKNELESWKYKKRSEIASEILGLFRTLHNNVINFYYKNSSMPTSIQNWNECPQKKISDCWEVYYSKVIQLIPNFPTRIAKKLDSHCLKTQNLVRDISEGIQIIREERDLTLKDIRMKAFANLKAGPDKLKDSLDRLTEILEYYIDIF